MEIVLQFIIVCVIAVIIKNVKVGLPLYIAYTFLVPYCKLNVGGIVLQQNLINTIVLLVVWVRARHLDIKPFYAFLLFYGLFLIAIPFADEASPSFQMNMWRSSLMMNLFLPVALWNLHSMKNAYGYINKFLITVIVIACVYGLFLTTMEGINPYAMSFYMLNGGDYNLDWFSADSRLFGRISSVFLHPMNYGMFLGCVLIYICSIKNKLHDKLFYVLLFLVLANMIICGVRSVLFATAITMSVFAVGCRNKKIIMSIAMLSVCILLVVNLIPQLSDYMHAVSDVSDQSDIKGSSVEMRFSQLEGAFTEVENNMFWGHGFSWHGDYIMKYENHPVLLAFESLVFIIICDHGLWGFIVYGIMIFVLLRTQRKYIRRSIDRLLLSCYILFYFLYCTFTGDYGYMKIWLIFYFITFSEMYVSQLHSYAGKISMGRQS